MSVSEEHNVCLCPPPSPIAASNRENDGEDVRYDALEFFGLVLLHM
jgi:hypothetical protein